MDSGLKALHRAQIQRQKIEEQCSLGLCGERNHLALLLLSCCLINMLKIGGLPAKARAIVHDLAIDLAGCEVDKAQDFPQATDRPRFLLLPRKLLIMRAKALRWIFGCNNGLYHSRAPQAWLRPLPFKAHVSH